MVGVAVQLSLETARSDQRVDSAGPSCTSAESRIHRRSSTSYTMTAGKEEKGQIVGRRRNRNEKSRRDSELERKIKREIRIEQFHMMARLGRKLTTVDTFFFKMLGRIQPSTGREDI